MLRAHGGDTAVGRVWEKDSTTGDLPRSGKQKSGLLGTAHPSPYHLVPTTCGYVSGI